MLLRFWGVRGTLPVPGKDTLGFGGNTSCVSLNLGRRAFFVFDAGSGIRVLSNWLEKNGGGRQGRIFISHPHWDHINAIPFFQPIYPAGNRFEILGPSNGGKSIHQLVSHLMDGIRFPVHIQKLAGISGFRDVKEESFRLDGADIQTLKLNHPGTCLGYRVLFKGRSVCYVTDNEIFPPNSPRFDPAYEKRLVAFIRRAHVLITDCTYTDAAYESMMGRGHSCVSQVARVAAGAQVKSLVLFHHDPEDTDRDVAAKVEHAAAILFEMSADIPCVGAKEGMAIRVGERGIDFFDADPLGPGMDP